MSLTVFASLRRHLFTLGLPVIFGICAYFAVSKYSIQQIVNAQVQVAPFKAEIVGFQFADPRSPQGTYLFRRIEARSSTSARVQLDNLAQFPADSFSRRIEFPDGRFAGIADFLKMKASGRFSTDEIAARRKVLLNMPPDCRIHKNDVAIGTVEFFGEQFVRVQSKDHQGNRLTHLRAPRLSCADLAWQNEQLEKDGSYRLLSEARLVALSLSEPSAELFDPAHSYQEASPSDIQRRFAESTGIACDKCADQWARQDSYYKSHQ